MAESDSGYMRCMPAVLSVFLLRNNDWVVEQSNKLVIAASR